MMKQLSTNLEGSVEEGVWPAPALYDTVGCCANVFALERRLAARGQAHDESPLINSQCIAFAIESTSSAPPVYVLWQWPVNKKLKNL